MADRGWHSAGHPSYKKDRVGQTDPSRGTSLDEIKRRSKQKNADKRFNSPFAFHEPKYNKVNLINRYPRLFGVGFTTVCVLLLYRYRNRNRRQF